MYWIISCRTVVWSLYIRTIIAQIHPKSLQYISANRYDILELHSKNIIFAGKKVTISI